MTDFIEASVPLGGFLVAFGLALLGLHALTGVFADWLLAVVLSGAWMAIGSLFLYPDVRLYQYEEAAIEQLLVDEPAD